MGDFYKYKKIKDFVGEMLEDNQYKDFKENLFRIQAKDVWAKVCGDMVASMTYDVVFKDKTFFVKMKSSALANELFYKRSEIVAKINQEYKEEIVKNIIIK